MPLRSPRVHRALCVKAFWLLHRREGGGLQEGVRDALDYRAVRFGLGALAMPFRIGLERVPLLLALGERVPFQQVIEGLVRVADQHRPEAGLLDPVALPDLQRDRVEAFQQIGQPARHGVIDAQFVDHLIPPSDRFSNPVITSRGDCFASLAMTAKGLSLREAEAGYFTDEKVVGVNIVLVIEATIGPFSSVLARAASHSGSAPNLPIFASRSASDSHFRK